MPDPPEGTLIYTTKNKFLIPMPIEDVLHALGLLEILGLKKPADFSKLPPPRQAEIRAMVQPRISSLQQKISMETPGACNAMVMTFLGRVFKKTAPIESPWLTPDEQIRIVGLQKQFVLAGLKRLFANSAPLSGADLNLLSDQDVFGHEYEINLLMDTSFSDAVVGQIAAFVKSISFCLLSVKFKDGAHAIGLINEGLKWYVLEPNFGLYRYASEEGFRLDLLRLIRGYGTVSVFLFAVSPGGADGPTSLSNLLLSRFANSTSTHGQI